MTLQDGQLASSFRDPSGALFERNGELYRQVNQPYRPHYDALIDSGLYQALVDRGLLIPHTEVDPSLSADSDAVYRVLQPERVGFISYPYEWSFSQLKDAALATLDIQLAALDQKLTLKDASAYNIQFHKGRATLIDTLSFEQYVDGQPWMAYRQFCQHFLAPLALAHYRDISLLKLSRIHLDGVPLDLASRLLPKRTRARWSILTHIHLHAATQRRYAESASSKADEKSTDSSNAPSKARKIPLNGLVALIKGLRGAVERLTFEPGGTEWADYYDATNYSEVAFDAKGRFVREAIERVKPRTVWDLGANDGTFSRIACDVGCQVVAFDIDPSAVEKNYLAVRSAVQDRRTGDLSTPLPLVLDLTNPSPALGWASRERDSLTERGPADCIMALALIHHLAISNNVPLDFIAHYFASLGHHAIVEFVPKSDSQVKRLLATREDIFPNYNRQGFIDAFEPLFEIVDSADVDGSEREIFFLKRRD